MRREKERDISHSFCIHSVVIHSFINQLIGHHCIVVLEIGLGVKTTSKAPGLMSVWDWDDFFIEVGENSANTVITQ